MNACAKQAYADNSGLCGGRGRCEVSDDSAYNDFLYSCDCGHEWNATNACMTPNDLCALSRNICGDAKSGICATIYRPPQQRELNANDKSLSSINNVTATTVAATMSAITATQCICLPGHYGSNCETTADYCQLNEPTCLNGGTCESLEYAYKCICPPTFTGVNCELKLRVACSSSAPCRNDEICEIKDGAQTAPRCVLKHDANFNRCATDENFCKQGVCRVDETTKQAYCSCPPQYSGIRCEKKAYIENFNIYFTGAAPTSHAQKIHSKRITPNFLEGITICGFVKIDGNEFGARRQNATSREKTRSNQPAFAVFGAVNANNSIIIELVRFTVSGVWIGFGDEASVNFTPYELSLNVWHFICVHLTGPTPNGFTPINYRVFVDGIFRFSDFRTTKFDAKIFGKEKNSEVTMAALFLGEPLEVESERAYFIGEITRFEVYEGVLSAKSMEIIRGRCGKNTPDTIAFDGGRLVSWFLDSSTDYGIVDAHSPHAVVVLPGICTNYNDRVGSPFVVSCPISQHFILPDSKRLHKIVWEDSREKMFTHSAAQVVSVSANYRPGHVFAPGKYRVVYMARDARGETAVCDFEIIVSRQICAQPNYNKSLVEVRLKKLPYKTDVKKCKANYENADARSHFSSAAQDVSEVAQLSCQAPTFIFSNPKASFYVCDAMGNWDAFLPSGASFNLPTCVSTTNVVQQVEGGVVFVDANCQRIGDYLAAVSERIVEASKAFGAFCRMPNCEGQLTLKSACQNVSVTHAKRKRQANIINIESVKHYDVVSRWKNVSTRDSERKKRSSGVFIQFKLRVNNTKHAVEPAIRDTMRANFGAENFFSGGAKLSCTQRDFPILHIKLSNKTNADDGSGREEPKTFSGGRTTFTIRKNVGAQNDSTTRVVDSQQFVLRCSTCGAGETWMSEAAAPRNIPFSWIFEKGELVVWAAMAGTDDDNVVGVGIHENVLLGTRAGVCARCPVDTFKDRMGVEACTKCLNGETTGGAQGCMRPNDCFLNCTLGQIFDFELNACVKCPKGQYMPYSGRLKCIPCPLGVTTLSTGATKAEDCSKTCGTGEELTVDEECVKCKIGTYRPTPSAEQQNRAAARVSVPHCIQCPSGFNTTREGASSTADCDRVYCPPGFKRRANNFAGAQINQTKFKPSDASFLDVCESCEYDFYQDEYDASACKRCPNGTMTEVRAATSEKMCARLTPIYCRPGDSVVVVAGNNAICPLGMECVLSSASLHVGQRDAIYECRNVSDASYALIDARSKRAEFLLLFSFGLLSCTLIILLFYSIAAFRRKWIILFYRYCPAWMLCCKKMTVNDITSSDYIRDATRLPTTRESATTIFVNADVEDGTAAERKIARRETISEAEEDNTSTDATLGPGLDADDELMKRVSVEERSNKILNNWKTKKYSNRTSDSNMTRWSASESENASTIGGFAENDRKNSSVEDPLDEIRSSLIECLVSNDEMEIPLPIELDATITPKQSQWRLNRSSSSPSLDSNRSRTKSPKSSASRTSSQKPVPAQLTVQTTMNRNDDEYQYTNYNRRKYREMTRTCTTPPAAYLARSAMNAAHRHTSDYARATNAVGRHMFSADDREFDVDETHKSIFHSKALFQQQNDNNQRRAALSNLRAPRLAHREMTRAANIEGADNIDRPKCLSDASRAPSSLSPILNATSTASENQAAPRKRVFRKSTRRKMSSSSSSSTYSSSTSTYSSSLKEETKPQNANVFKSQFSASQLNERPKMTRQHFNNSAIKQKTESFNRSQTADEKHQSGIISYDDDDDAFFS